MDSAVTGFVALTAGIVSFLSPCVLPLVPAYLSYISGVGLGSHNSEGVCGKRFRVFGHAILFVAGFSLVFVALGWSTSLLGRLFFVYGAWIRRVGGLIIVFFGLSMLEVIRLPFLEREYRFQLQLRPASYLGSLLVGIVFGAGWTPCIGPVLGSILLLASTSPGQGAYLLGLYALGLAIPFVFSVFFIDRLLVFRRYTVMVQRVGGVLLIIMGLFLVTGFISEFSNLLIRMFN